MNCENMEPVIGISISGECSRYMRDLLMSILQLSLTCDRYLNIRLTSIRSRSRGKDMSYVVGYHRPLLSSRHIVKI